MIWIIAGTKDGRELALKLANKSSENILVSVATNYGASLLENSNIKVITARLNQEEMQSLIAKYDITKIIDASHPYADIVTKTAHLASLAMGIDYIRYERESLALPEYDKIHHVANADEAAKKAGEIISNGEGSIFLTTGSKTLANFVNCKSLAGKTIKVRVLPTVEVLEICRKLAISPKNILAMQGPFSYEMNYWMFKDSMAKIVVMKNSGLVGGTDTKLLAAIDLGLDIIVIDRPALPENIKIANCIEDVLN